METQRERYILEDVLVVLFKHKYKILSAFFTVMVAVTIKTALTVPVFESNAELMVQPGRELIYRNEVGEDNERQILALDGLIRAQAQILKSTDLIEAVVTDIG